MQKKKIIGVILSVMMILLLASCSNNSNGNDSTNQSENIGVSIHENDVSTSDSDDLEVEQEYTGTIYLYGEKHGIDKIIDKEYELWYEYYHQQGMRHLFIESPYYTAEFLNLWMQSDNNDILDELFVDWMGTMKHNPKYKEFYEKIKKECPQTIFHGTDVGHQYASIGQRYLDYLSSNNMLDSDKYSIAKEVIKQGEEYSNSNSSVYREKMMVENFYRELRTLSDESIMGIYGAIHTNIEGMDKSNSVPSMANQIKELYKDNIYTEDLSVLAIYTEPERIDTIELMGKTYEASYFGKHNMDFTNEYKYREFWRLENAYNDFKNCILTMNGLPETNYPIAIEENQVFMVDYTKSNNTVERVYYRVDGFVWDDMLSSEQFILKEVERVPEAEKEDIITIGETDYIAYYFGKHDFGGQFGTDSVEYWRVEDAYDDFKDAPLDTSGLPYNMYPMTIETGQVFVLDITLTDGTVHRAYMRSDGNEWRAKISTEGFKIQN